jgi:hypothetical protein
MINKDAKLIAEAYSKILGEGIPASNNNEDNPDMEKMRNSHLEKSQNYMFTLKSKGFKQVESGGSLNKFVRGKDVVTVDKKLDDTFVVTVNGEAWTGTLNALHKKLK